MITAKSGFCSTEALEGFNAVFRPKVLNSSHIVIVSHKNPDGDAVGSVLALVHALRRSGLNIIPMFPDVSPDFLKWLPGYHEVIHFQRKPEKAAQIIDKADLIVMVDFNDLDRLAEMGSMISRSKAYKVLIDHHPGSGNFADLCLICPELGSTSELIYRILEDPNSDFMVNQLVGTCLLTGIITDTVGFRVSSSYPDVFEVVARLLSLGVDKEFIFNKIYDQFSVDRMRLLGYCLNEKMIVLPEYQTAYIWITREELNLYRHLKGDTEGFVNYPLSISGVRFAVLFTEQEDHIKLSLRSKGSFPANHVAKEFFDGGGHLNAAGGKCYKPFAETLEYFHEILKQYKNQLTQ